MKKIKKVIASALAAASVATCMVVPASAETISLTKGRPIATTNMVASRVIISGQCSSSSESMAHFRLGYSSGGYLITDKTYILAPGGYFYNVTSSSLDANTIWTYSVKPYNTNKLNGVATGTIEPY